MTLGQRAYTIHASASARDQLGFAMGGWPTGDQPPTAVRAWPTWDHLPTAVRAMWDIVAEEALQQQPPPSSTISDDAFRRARWGLMPQGAL